MALKCGIVGLPNVGKSTLFNCISSGKAQSANFPFCTIEPNIGSTIVPDERLQVLEKLVKPNTKPAKAPFFAYSMPLLIPHKEPSITIR